MASIHLTVIGLSSANVCDISRLHLRQPPRDVQIFDSYRQSQHPISWLMPSDCLILFILVDPTSDAFLHGWLCIMLSFVGYPGPRCFLCILYATPILGPTTFPALLVSLCAALASLMQCDCCAPALVGLIQYKYLYNLFSCSLKLADTVVLRRPFLFLALAHPFVLQG